MYALTSTFLELLFRLSSNTFIRVEFEATLTTSVKNTLLNLPRKLLIGLLQLVGETEANVALFSVRMNIGSQYFL